MKNLANELFKVCMPPRLPECGSILVAEPFLDDKYFNHGVISLIDYIAEEGATGVVMNNRTEFFLSDLLKDIGSGADIPVFCGGPLGLDRLYFIHTLGPDIISGARMFAPGLFVGGRFDAMCEYLNNSYPVEGYVRFFIGYSSWTSGQLEHEIEEGTWAQLPVPENPTDLLCGLADSYWHREVRKLGECYRSWQLIPRNPEYN